MAKIVRCYGSKKRAMIDERSIFDSKNNFDLQFAKESLHAECCVSAEQLTWADAFDPTVIVGSEGS